MSYEREPYERASAISPTWISKHEASDSLPRAVKRAITEMVASYEPWWKDDTDPNEPVVAAHFETTRIVSLVTGMSMAPTMMAIVDNGGDVFGMITPEVLEAFRAAASRAWGNYVANQVVRDAVHRTRLTSLPTFPQRMREATASELVSRARASVDYIVIASRLTDLIPNERQLRERFQHLSDLQVVALLTLQIRDAPGSIEMLSPDEIADLLDCTVPSVQQARSKARESLGITAHP